MKVIYIAEPILSTKADKLVAVEVLSRVYSETGMLLSTQMVLSNIATTMKINLLKAQLNAIVKLKTFLNIMIYCALFMLITILDV